MRPELTTIAVLAVSGVVLGAWYMLWLVQRVFFGPLKEPHAAHHDIEDLSLREILALAPLAVFVLWIGLRPGDFLTPMQPALELARSPAATALDNLNHQPASHDAPLTYSPTHHTLPAPEIARAR
jgi:NADH-quinone oxidoreductase subunit M